MKYFSYFDVSLLFSSFFLSFLSIFPSPLSFIFFFLLYLFLPSFLLSLFHYILTLPSSFVPSSFPPSLFPFLPFLFLCVYVVILEYNLYTVFFCYTRGFIYDIILDNFSQFSMDTEKRLYFFLGY